MIRHMRNLGRLMRAAWVLSRYDALFAIDAGESPAPVRAARTVARLRQTFGRTHGADSSEGDRLAAAMTELGPSYIKLGQFLATRPDVMEAHSMSGEGDYLLRIVAADVAGYERFLMRDLLNHSNVATAASHFALSQVKYTTAVPL